MTQTEYAEIRLRISEIESHLVKLQELIGSLDYYVNTPADRKANTPVDRKADATGICACGHPIDVHQGTLGCMVMQDREYCPCEEGHHKGPFGYNSILADRLSGDK